MGLSLWWTARSICSLQSSSAAASSRTVCIPPTPLMLNHGVVAWHALTRCHLLFRSRCVIASSISMPWQVGILLAVTQLAPCIITGTHKWATGLPMTTTGSIGLGAYCPNCPAPTALRYSGAYCRVLPQLPLCYSGANCRVLLQLPLCYSGAQ